MWVFTIGDTLQWVDLKYYAMVFQISYQGMKPLRRRQIGFSNIQQPF